MRDEVFIIIVVALCTVSGTLMYIFGPADGGKQPCKCQAVPVQTQAK